MKPNPESTIDAKGRPLELDSLQSSQLARHALPSFQGRRRMPPRPLIVFASSLDAGGSERQTILLLDRLDRHHWQPHLVLFHRRGVFLKMVPEDVPVNAYWDQASTPRFWIPGQIHRQQIHWFRDQIKRVQAVAVYDRTYHCALVSAPATASENIARVSVITSPPHQELAASRERWVGLKRRALSRAYRTATYVAAVSTATARSAEVFYGLPALSVGLLPNPVDSNAVTKAASGELAIEIDRSKLNVACVARMTEEKGHRILIQAMAELHRNSPQAAIHFWFAGDGPLRPKLEELVNRSGLSDWVTFLGHLADSPRLTQRCDLLCLVSHYEGLPNVVMEAMVLGVPVLATHVGGTVELAGNCNAIELIPPNNPQAIVEAILDCLRDRGPWQQRAERAKAVIAERDATQLIPKVSDRLLSAVRKNQGN